MQISPIKYMTIVYFQINVYKIRAKIKFNKYFIGLFLKFFHKAINFNYLKCFLKKISKQNPIKRR